MKSQLFLFWIFLASSRAFEEVDWSNVRPIWEIHQLEKNGFREINDTRRYPGISERIAGGEIAGANPREFRFMVALIPRFRMTEGLCGGSLISRKMVLTAAHCLRLNLEISESTLAIVGAHNIQYNEPSQERIRVPCSKYIIHPQYSQVSMSNDIAMLKLSDEVTPNEHVTLVNLPFDNDIRNKTFLGDKGILPGWGRYSATSQVTSDKLRFVVKPIIENRECAIRYPMLFRSNQICAGSLNGPGGCLGDTGGPLVINYQLANTTVEREAQVGIFSYGNNMVCGSVWPSVFTRITAHRKFIEDNLIETDESSPPPAPETEVPDF